MTSFAPETIFWIGRFPVTNTVINTIFVDGILLILAFATRSKLVLIPGKFQNLMEYLISSIHGFVGSIAEDKTNAVFPVFMSFFLFIIIANLSGLIPGLGTLGIYEHTVENGKAVTQFIPFNRSATSDLNTTLALAVVSLVITNGYAIHRLGLKEYLTKFFAFIPFLIRLSQGKPNIKINWKNPLDVFISVLTPVVMIFVGFLELLSEFVKAVSLSFRLFGNIFAGDVVLSTVHSIFAFIFPVPFLMLELITGAIQALVFSMLTMVFMIILSSSHHEDEAGLKEVSH